MIASAFFVLDGSKEQVYDNKGEVRGLILYNPDSRDGATKEAEDLHSGLQAVGCQVKEKMWTTKVELNNFIEEGLYSIDECSLLVVCIMSHGTAGYLRCSDGDGSVVINDVLIRFSRVLPEHIPLVRYPFNLACVYLKQNTQLHLIHKVLAPKL